MIETLDCREGVRSLYDTTLVTVATVKATEPSCCFHDGLPLDPVSSFSFNDILFCSASCALAFFPVGVHPSIYLVLNSLEPCGVTIPPSAPGRSQLQCYGGKLTLVQFRGSGYCDSAVLRDCDSAPRCLYDNHLLDNPPVFFRRFYKNAFFCSDACILAHICEFVLPGGIPETEIRSRRNDPLGSPFPGGSSQLIPAPSRFLLEVFGGKFSIEKFRANTSYCNVFPARYLLPDTGLASAFSTLHSHYENQVFFGTERTRRDEDISKEPKSKENQFVLQKNSTTLGGVRVNVRRKPDFLKSSVCHNLPFHRKK